MVSCNISMSLDGYVAGPEPTLEEPLGRGGEQLHEWALRVKAFRETHGMEGGETGPDDDVIREWLERSGAVVMGRRMFSGGSGRWEDDPNAGGWWGDEPPFHSPVFVLTHHARDTVEKGGGTSYVFVTDGPEAALAQAREAAGGKDVQLGGGASVIRQFLDAGLLDELNIHLAPVLLGGGVRLFEGAQPMQLELEHVIDSPHATHLRYRVTR
ncbi:MAG: dihydrofolate reductase family protein [Gaiellaceae bacterium]